MQANGPRIRELRRERRETIAQLSVRIGIGSETLARIERGGIDARRVTLDAIARGLDVPLDDLVLDETPAEVAAS